MSFQTKPANQRHELTSALSIACPTQETVFIQPQSDSPASRASLKSLLAAIPSSTQVTIDCTRINSISDQMLQVMWSFKGDGQLHITLNHLAEFQAKRSYLEKAEPIKKEGGQSHGTYKLKRSKLQITTDPAVPPSDNYQELWAGWIENIPTNKPSINTVVATANSDVKWDTNLDIPSSQKPRSCNASAENGNQAIAASLVSEQLIALEERAIEFSRSRFLAARAASSLISRALNISSSFPFNLSSGVM